ncbi:helix-turn-helix transcriptional regulator [Mesorhizobium sp.]|uniref:helix-turn-helix domain-containing protein n=1 Tax=Mesorhizobium sp. TaxID=1871066 RepID=UPI0025D91FF0|nr:helix-turn-helix transcriptional regulator [Mesorhizobium sp.]
MSLNIEIGGLLAKARERASLTQAELAKRWQTSQTRVSRLEAGDPAFEATDHLAYLDALGSPDVERLRDLISAEWRHLPRPSLLHPDVDGLLKAEEALERLSQFLATEDVPRAVAGQAEMLSRRIYEFADYLRSLHHRVAFIGDIGVGKTTAACRQAGLVLSPESAADLRGILLDTGGGRVTLCEVSVLSGSSFAIDVEPLPDEEVYRLVADFCRSVKVASEATDDAPAPAADYRPAEEVERAIRNMCGLARPPRRKGVIHTDPAADILAAHPELEDFRAEVAAKLTLWRRTRRQIAYEGADEAQGRQWLKETFAAINNGRHSEFSLPGRITVTVPFSISQGSAYEVELVDTRGVDLSAVRPDIVAQLKDRRTVSVLCSRFNSAPDISLQGLLQHMGETEVDASFRTRALVLVLARPGEALEMRDDSGLGAQSAEDGYDIKRGHVEDALTKIGSGGLDVEFFDSTADDPESLTQTLALRIGQIRAAHATSMVAATRAVDQMLANVAEAQALAVLDEINGELTIFANRHSLLRRIDLPVHERLISALRFRHPRTVWAATRRSGMFWNFDVYQHIGDGAAAQTKRRCAPIIHGLREILENKLNNPELESAHDFIGQLLDDLSTWEADLVEAARHFAVSIYRPVLKDADELWETCEDYYGIGRSDYRGDVADAVQSWFVDNPELADKVERRIQRSWKNSVLLKMRNAAGEAPAEDATSAP